VETALLREEDPEKLRAFGQALESLDDPTYASAIVKLGALAGRLERHERRARERRKAR
jgi:hypothetical protein